METLLQIEDLEVDVEDRKILAGFNLTINKGENAAIMGPNGAGKSTLAAILAGKDNYQSIKGSIRYLGKDLLKMSVEERAAKGLFLAFQYPVEIPGVSMSNFIRIALNAQKKFRGEKEVNAVEFLELARAKAKELKMNEDFFQRSVNVGFSGGEKKRNETLQLLVLDPVLTILDETDSGLDVDALDIVSDGIVGMKNEENSFLVITHYKKLLDKLSPSKVHILVDGRIVESGGPDLADKIENKGFESFN